jgi:hypothetical protein
MPLVKIVAGHRVEMYATNYGVGPISTFEDGEFYEVSDSILSIMLGHEWAKEVSLDEVPRQPIEDDLPEPRPTPRRGKRDADPRP